MGNNCSSSKAALVISVVALSVAGVSYFYPKKNTDQGQPSEADEKFKNVVLETVRSHPQEVMDAIGDGMVKKREEAVAKLAKVVVEKKKKFSEMAIHLGNRSTNASFVIFFDPLCKHCIELLKDILKILESDLAGKVNFIMLPVAVIGEDSVMISSVCYAVYEKAPDRIQSFIKYISGLAEPVDRNKIEDGLKAIGLTQKDIEPLLQNSNKKVAENGKEAEGMGLPVIPAVFYDNGPTPEMLQTPDFENMKKLINGKTGDKKDPE